MGTQGPPCHRKGRKGISKVSAGINPPRPCTARQDLEVLAPCAKTPVLLVHISPLRSKLTLFACL